VHALAVVKKCFKGRERGKQLTSSGIVEILPGLSSIINRPREGTPRRKKKEEEGWKN
jgi:hypothetical protein